MTRRVWISTGLLVVCAVALAVALPGTAWGRPVVRFRAADVPIPIDLRNPRSATYPGTGSILGAGAAAEAEWKITGTEYDGSPSPLTWIKVYSPRGTRLDPQAFGTCSAAILAAGGPLGCPTDSIAGLIGEGNRSRHVRRRARIPETASVEAFFRLGGLMFFAFGHSPVLFEATALGTILPERVPFAQLFTGEVPLVHTVPEGPDASLERMKITLGAAFKRGGSSSPGLRSRGPVRETGYRVKSELSRIC